MSAPTASLETVMFVRPLKVVSMVCGFLSVTLMLVSVCSTAWLQADDYRQGLWSECFTNHDGTISCQPNTFTDWITACAILCVFGLIINNTASVLIAVGLSVTTPHVKYLLYRVALYLMFVTVILFVVSLIVFPTMFMQEITERGKPTWFFGWAYGVAWGAAVFTFGSSILLLIDKETDEFIYREKTLYPEMDGDTPPL